MQRYSTPRQRSHHGHRDMGSSSSAGPLTTASLFNAVGGQRSRGAILWHPAGRHQNFLEKMSRRSGPGRQGAHRAEHAATQKAAASLGGDERPPFMFPSRASEVREVRLQQRTTTQCVARTTSRCHVPANSMSTIRVTGRQKPACHLLASPLAQPLPRGLLMVPTLSSSDPYSRFVRVANLSNEDVLLPARTPMAVLQVIDRVDSTDIHFTVAVLVSMSWWCQERLPAVQPIRHPQTTFPALTSMGPAANGISNVPVGSDGQSHKTVSPNHNLFEEKGEPKQYQT